MPALRSMEERVPAAAWVRLSHYELEGPVKRAGDIAAAAFSRGGATGTATESPKGVESMSVGPENPSSVDVVSACVSGS